MSKARARDKRQFPTPNSQFPINLIRLGVGRRRWELGVGSWKLTQFSNLLIQRVERLLEHLPMGRRGRALEVGGGSGPGKLQ